jgi:sulfofructose kinase
MVDYPKIDVLCVGTAAYDLVFEVDRHPGADEKAAANSFHRGGGGPAANAAVAVNRLGMRAAFFGYLGNDVFGKLHMDELINEGVETMWIQRGSTPTPLSTVLIKPGGARSLVNYNEHKGLKNVPGDMLPEIRPDVILFDGWEPDVSIELLEYAAKHKITTVLDAGSVHRGTSLLAPQVDYLVSSEKFALQYAGTNDTEAALAEISKITQNIVVITCGSQGSIWQNGTAKGKTEAFDVMARDTNGAGDAFHGAFAAGLCSGLDWPALLRFASASAAICCTRIGARAGLPHKTEVDKFLAVNG